ncbi:MAG: toll/interleukin-1 receptor domain-containing protein, partial [Acidimicrobiia bacterium]
MKYKAFISYSHAADGEFAESVHDAMERLAKPWNKRRARRIVFDKTAMAAGASLADTIEEKLHDSEWLILLASPESAQSKWCDEEIDYWAAHKSMDNVVIALTGGDIEIDPTTQRVDWENSTALSSHFRDAVGDDAVPLFEDLRSFKRDPDHL